MWFRKVFVWVLLVFGVFSHSLIAEDSNQSKEYTLLKFFQDTKMAGDISTAIFKVGGYLKLDESVIDSLLASEVELYKGASRAVNNNLGIWSNQSISFVKKGKEDLLKIIEQKDISYHEIQAKFSNYLGTGLDILGAGLDAHDLGENLVKLWDNEGNPNIANWQRAMVNVGKVSQNVYGLTAGTASLMGTFVPKGVIATSKYAQFFKNASVVNRTNFILMTLQLNSVAYSYFRDQEIDEILLYAGKEYQSKLSMRNLILDQLFKA